MEKMNSGTRLNIRAGETFFHSNESLDKIFLIVKGQARVENAYIDYELEPGAIIGIIDIGTGKYQFDYTAITDMIVLMFEIKDENGIYQILDFGKNYQELAITTMLSQLGKVMQIYLDRFSSVVLECVESSQNESHNIPKLDLGIWEYLSAIGSLPKNMFHELFTNVDVIAFEHIKMGAGLAKQVCVVMNQMANIYGAELFTQSAQKLTGDLIDQSMINEEDQLIESMKQEAVQEVETTMRQHPENSAQIEKELDHSLEKILKYSGLDMLEAKKFEGMVHKYLGLSDRYSSDNEVRQLRKEISEGFYQIYELAFLKAVHEEKLDRVIELFLRYGFMDERDFSKNQLTQLYDLSDDFSNTDYTIYNIYDWLCAVYRGEREPSKNEMDIDYKENLRELKRTKNFTQQEENSYLSDQENKVRFEIHNLMRTTSKITSGTITSFCPILEGRNLGNTIAQIKLTGSKIKEAMDQLQSIDYSVFYREQMYYDAENKIDNILVMKKVLPDFILMPNAGSRGIMWQEISEKKRDTPARMVMPAFVTANISDLIIQMAATFRWEMCRTVQGNYWNDIRDHSLTSEYCDYIQFYRKNKDLSDEMKEKVRTQFKSCRNSYKEMFVKDYDMWIKYESKGSLRLNKAARKILYMYCPFSASYRENISKQPIYEEACARFNKIRQAKVRELKSFNANVLKRNGKITDILDENLAFYEKM